MPGSSQTIVPAGIADIASARTLAAGSIDDVRFDELFGNLADPAGQKALRALPGHRFVLHKSGDAVHYLYAEPLHRVCIFVGTQQNYRDYRDIVELGLLQADNVAPDYKTQARALLDGDPYDFNSLNEPDSLAEFFRDYY
jgi:hypothetical protein